MTDKKKVPHLPIVHREPPPFIDGIRGNESGHTYTFWGKKMPWHDDDKPFGWSTEEWDAWKKYQESWYDEEDYEED